MSYVGVPPFGQTVRTVTEVTAQQDQVTFYPTGGYLPGYIDIELDGSDLGSQDFTATDGLSVVLTQKCGAGDLFRSKAYWPVAMVDTMRRAEINGIVGAGGWAMRNRLINGDMRVDQRNNGASVAGSAGYTLDRWTFDSSNPGNFTAQRVSDAPAGFINSVKITTTTAFAANLAQFFNQNIEGYNVADLAWGTSAAQPVTVSLWVKASIAGAYSVALTNSSNNYAFPTTFTVNQANTWEYKTFVVPGATSGTWLTSNSVGLRIKFNIGSGSVYDSTANTWVAADKATVAGSVALSATLNATLQFTGIQLEKGSYATPFDFRPIGTELALCQRYYYKYSTQNWAGIRYSGTSPWMTTNFPVTMRATPTVATSFTSLYCTTGTLNSMPVYSATVDGVSIYFYTSNTGTDFGAALSYTSSAEL
jgi:hypothetical protein